jgi:hypothetical protein
MGLKGYRLWVMGQLDSNVQSPTSSVRTLNHALFELHDSQLNPWMQRYTSCV